MEDLLIRLKLDLSEAVTIADLERGILFNIELDELMLDVLIALVVIIFPLI